jgi:hypothetical protein
MPRIKDLTLLRPMGVLSSACTTAADPTRALPAPHPIKPTSPRCPSAGQPNHGRDSTYRCGDSVQTTGTTAAAPHGCWPKITGHFLVNKGAVAACSTNRRQLSLCKGASRHDFPFWVSELSGCIRRDFRVLLTIYVANIAGLAGGGRDRACAFC